MISFNKYPHVRDLLLHYADDLNNNKVDEILDNGISCADDAEVLSRFIWAMADRMSEDSNADITVLGRTDNSDMLPDVEYEITLHIENAGHSAIWDRVSDEENP